MRAVIKRLARRLAALVLACAGAAIAQDRPAGYPDRPIRIIVSVAPGAGADAIARAVGQMLTERWGQSAVVDNRSGGGGAIAMELAAKAAPDGYTLLSQGDTVVLLGVLKRVPFDVRKAYDPIVPTSAQPYVLIANLGLPARTIKELVAYSAGQTVNYAGGAGVGSNVHLGIEHLAQLSGAKLLYVPYKGSAPSIVAVISGEIHMAAVSSIAASGALRTGKVRALAAMGLTRIPAMPDLPTVAEQGYPGFKITNRYNLFAPAGTPRAIVAAINRVVSDGMHAPQMAQRLAADGSQPAERMSPEQLKAALAHEYAEVAQQIKRLNLKLE